MAEVNAPCTPGAIAQALGIANANEIPSMNNRDHNFATFVKQHFLIETNIMEDLYIYSWPEHGLLYLKAYKTLQEYARTPYGAMMIKNILQDHKIPGRVRFLVR